MTLNKIQVYKAKDGEERWEMYCPCCNEHFHFYPWVLRKVGYSDFYFVGVHIDRRHPKKKGFFNAFGHWVKSAAASFNEASYR